ncbi:MAG: hypothetical protein GH156_00505 [Dehalococcoidia bacterium]|nr:hypothetical protein [Dehalococcoidia bacterium]
MAVEKSWKRTKRRVARSFGGRCHSSREAGVPDVEAGPFAIEVKERGRFPGWLRLALKQARRKAKIGQLPLVVLCQPGRTDDMVLLSRSDFINWFGTGGVAL